MEIAAAVEDEFHDVCETHVYIFGNTARLMSLCAALLQRELSLCEPAGVPLSPAAEVVRTALLAELQQLAASPGWRGVESIGTSK